MELNRSGAIARLQSRMMTIDEFNFDQLSAPPLMSLLSPYDIDRLYNVATSLRYSGNAHKKFKEIDSILKPRGFSKLSGGTNRLCYKFIEDQSFCIKVAYDGIGIRDNPKEFKNQMIFKPFVTKVFEESSCGTVGLFERVDAINSREEFFSVADDIYEVITKWFIGKHIMADIGTHFFMNWGIRRGFGPVLLDFPYCYELDGNKLYCSAPNINSPTGRCDGEIDFDAGFNFLHCERCGLRYRVKELAKAIKEENITIKGKGGHVKMKVSASRNGVKVSTSNDADGLLGNAVSSIKKASKAVQSGTLQVAITRTSVPKESEQQSQDVVRTLQTQHPNNRGVAIRGAASSTMEVKAGKSEGNSQLVASGIILEDNSAEQINNLQANITSLQGLVEEKDNEIADLQRQLENYKGSYEELKSEIAAMKQAGEDTSNENAESIPDLSELENNIELLEKDIADLNKMISKREEEMKGLEAQVIDLKNKLSEKNAENAVLQDRVNELEADAENKTEAGETNFSEVIEELRQQIADKDVELMHQEEYIKKYQAEQKDLKKQLKDKDKEWSKLLKEQEKKTKAAEDKAKKAASNDEKDFKINELEEVINAQESKIDKLVTALQEVARHLISESRIDADYTEHEGFTVLDASVSTIGEISKDNSREDSETKVLAFLMDDEDETSVLQDGEGNTVVVGFISGSAIDYLSPTSLADIVDSDIYNSYLSDLEAQEN